MQAEFLLITEKSDALTITEVKNREYRMHFHSNIELCIVVEGELEVWINDHYRVLKQGELSVAWSYDAHGYHTPSHSVSLSTIIPPRFYNEFLPLLSNRCASDPFLTDPLIFEQIHSWARSAAKCGDDMLRKGYVYLILGTILKNMRFEDAPAQSDPHVLSQALLYVNERFREPLSLPLAAHAIGYHPNTLSNAFKSTLGLSFNQYLTLLRLREAVRLLQEGDKSITECALESGFQSLRTFYRAFQTEFGCTPREFASDDGL